MADKVVVSIAVLFVAFLLPYLFQWYRAHYYPEAIIDDVDVPDDLALHSEEFEQPNIIMVTKGLYVAIGYALANSILIEAPEGNIVVDTTEAISSGREIRAAFRNVSDRPIVAIIYTHNHPDHTFGAEAFIDDPSNPPDIWGHHTLVRQLQRIAMTGPLIYRRSIKQFGRFIPNLVNSGIGPRLHYDKEASHGLIYPNKFLYDDEEDVVIAGMSMRLVHIPGETPDQMGVWLPDHDAFLCGDDVYKAFPNLYAIRGTPARDVMDWVKSLDKMLKIDPHHLVLSHTRPLEGREKIRSIVTTYRDAIQYVHDQTVRYMNKGMHPDDIVRMVKLPDHLRAHPYLKEFYGTVEWSIRGVFDSYMGWFSGDVVDLSPMGTVEKAEKMVDLAGGLHATLKRAQSAFDKGELQWALELASAAFKVSPGHNLARRIRLKILRALASKQTSANGRNYHLTCALEDHGRINNRLDMSRALLKIPMNQIFNAMATRIKPEQCGTYDMKVVFNFADTGEVFKGHLRNGILVTRKVTSTADDGDVTVVISTKSLIWREILGKTRNPAMAYILGDISLEGGLMNFVSFLRCFDREL